MASKNIGPIFIHFLLAIVDHSMQLITSYKVFATVNQFLFQYHLEVLDLMVKNCQMLQEMASLHPWILWTSFLSCYLKGLWMVIPLCRDSHWSGK